MPTVEVNGDLESALFDFKRRVNREGLINEFKAAQAFVPASQQRYWDNRWRERKARTQAERERRRAEW